MTLTCTEPTLDDIQKAIRTRLDTIEGLHAFAWEPDKPIFPCAYPRVVDWAYDQTLGDPTTLWHFDVWILVGLAPGFAYSQEWLNSYIAPTGPHSIKEAIDRDPSLGRTVDFARAVGGGSYGRIEIAGITGLGASMRVEIQT